MVRFTRLDSVIIPKWLSFKLWRLVLRDTIPATVRLETSSRIANDVINQWVWFIHDQKCDEGISFGTGLEENESRIVNVHSRTTTAVILKQRIS